MRAVGYQEPLPVDNPKSLLDIEVPSPQALGHDLLVEVRAISVNPVDTKVRKRARPEPGQYKILGWDAAGVVKSVGADCSLFKAEDEVYYAGSIARQGSNAELQLVDERITGRKPRNLSFPEAAAMPLTTITAWELLFDRLGVKKGESQGSLLVVGGAGGVGSILIQLARQLTGLQIIATASRPETTEWCQELGAHHVIDHTKSLPEQLKKIGIPTVERIASLTGTDLHYPALIETVAPQGKIGLIDDPKTLDAMPLKSKCASLHWEFMFARPVYGTPDMIAQHHLLNETAELVESGTLRTTLTGILGTISADNLKKAHAQIESGRAKGKVVLAGF